MADQLKACVTCRECYGHGCVDTFEDIWIHGSGHSTRDITMECKTCEGTGVDPECGCDACTEE